MLISRSGSAFFGLTQQYRVELFSTIHQIVFNSKGGYDHDTVYNMPIWLRNYTFSTMREFYDKERTQNEKLYNKGQGKGKELVVGPPIPQNATYTTKARK